MKFSNLNSKKVVNTFIKMGFKKISQRGTHIVLKGNINGKTKTIVIPVHHKEIPIGTLSSIINNEANITREEFFKYY